MTCGITIAARNTRSLDPALVRMPCGLEPSAMSPLKAFA
jgi:hypothetical protein